MDCGLILNQILTKIGGSRIDDESGWANFTDPRVVDFLLKYGKEFSTEGLEYLQETPFLAIISLWILFSVIRTVSICGVM